VNADERRTHLLEQFVGCWEKLDGFSWDESLDSLACQFSTGDENQLGGKLWRPIPRVTDPSTLDPLYAQLPARFPPLYEQLVLTYRWADVDLGSYRLLGNPIGPSLSGLLDLMLKDKFLSTFLLKSGYIPFGKGPDIDYDPVCFDLKSRKKNREFSIVKLDHEEILCNERIRVVAELAPTFEQLVKTTIELASRS
jgi:hypothetical protein